MLRVGFSTGTLYKSRLSMLDGVTLFKKIGAQALELSFATPSHLSMFDLTESIVDAVQSFRYVSIHAPWKEITYSSDSNSKKIIANLKMICKSLPIEGIVLHPDTIKDNKLLLASGLPFLIENMDNRKNFGVSENDFIKLKESNFGFVLDLQHAWEHDPSMNLSKRLRTVMGNLLRHIHLSGCTSNNLHSPLHLSKNRKVISSQLKKLKKYPIVLEGLPIGDIEKVAKQEYDYILKTLKE